MVCVRELVATQLILGLIITMSSMNCANGEETIEEDLQNDLMSHRASPPVPAPAPAPVPVKPPPPAFRISAAVEGVVYCTSCKLPGYVASMNASPLPNVTASLVCVTKKLVTVHGNATTNARGYFLVRVKDRKPSTLVACKVTLRLPVWCDRPVAPESVRAGIPVKFERIDRVGPSGYYVLFTTGFLEFGPARARMCPRQLQ